MSSSPYNKMSMSMVRGANLFSARTRPNCASKGRKTVNLRSVREREVLIRTTALRKSEPPNPNAGVCQAEETATMSTCSPNRCNARGRFFTGLIFEPKARYTWICFTSVGVTAFNLYSHRFCEADSSGLLNPYTHFLDVGFL